MERGPANAGGGAGAELDLVTEEGSELDSTQQEQCQGDRNQGELNQRLRPLSRSTLQVRIGIGRFCKN
jgi:hypothetical protein